MKQAVPLLLLVLVLAGGAFLFWKRDRVVEYYHETIVARQAPEPAPAAREELPTPPPVSRVPPPDPAGTKQFASPGTFYVIKRKKLESRIGVQAVNPGELVQLVERYSDGRVRVTIDNIDFTMQPNEVTTDLDVAREAEKNYFESLRSRR